MNLKKPISAMMTTMLAVSMATVPAFAASTLDQSSSTDVTASVSSSYTIVVPQTVAMTGDAGTGEKTATVSVTVKGDIPEDQTVTVSTTAPVMKRDGSGDVTAKVTSPKTTWNRTELLNTGTKSDYTVAATLTPGSWSGVMTFSCSLA